MRCLADSRELRLMASSLGWLPTRDVMRRCSETKGCEAQNAQRHPGGGAGSGTAGASPIWAPKSLAAPSGWPGFGRGSFCHLQVRYSSTTSRDKRPAQHSRGSFHGQRARPALKHSVCVRPNFIETMGVIGHRLPDGGLWRRWIACRQMSARGGASTAGISRTPARWPMRGSCDELDPVGPHERPRPLCLPPGHPHSAAHAQGQPYQGVAAASLATHTSPGRLKVNLYSLEISHA